MSGSAPSAAWLWTGRIAFALSLAVSVAYFTCLAVPATPLGARDMGLSLLCAFVSAAAAYASFALAAADALLLSVAAVVGGPRGRLAVALLVALLPGVVLLVQHLAGI
ncbi:MAG: hypothetical protein ABW221_25765 [Vicinamibacteria bacterium]